MTAKQSFATILAMLLALVLLGGCSPSSVETPLLTVIFGDTAIPAYSALMSGRTYAENGWVLPTALMPNTLSRKITGSFRLSQ